MATDFQADVKAWAEKVRAKADANVRAITVALFSSVIQSTPVDSGRARGNWQTTVDVPASGTVERDDPSGAKAVADITKNMGGAGKVTYLTNNLPYIDVLEYGLYPDPAKHGTKTKDGFSKQAPQGMVRVNMARIQEIAKRALKG